jgi:hypothetical protein
VGCYGYGGAGRGENESGDEDSTNDRNVNLDPSRGEVRSLTPTRVSRVYVAWAARLHSFTGSRGASPYALNHVQPLKNATHSPPPTSPTPPFSNPPPTPRSNSPLHVKRDPIQTRCGAVQSRSWAVEGVYAP